LCIANCENAPKGVAQIAEQKDNNEDIKECGEHTQRELASTIKEWLRQVKLIPDLTNIPLSDSDRTGHLPKLFEDVLNRLRLARGVEPLLSIDASAHGGLRFAQGYSASMLVEESRIFQVTTFGTLQLHQSELDQSEVLLDVVTIADEADRQLRETVGGFMTAQQAAVA